MKQDRSGRTLEDYRELFWEAEKTIKKLEAHADALVGELELAKGVIEELEAKPDYPHEEIAAMQSKLDAVKNCKRYNIMYEDGQLDSRIVVTRPATGGKYMKVTDVLGTAIGEGDGN